MINAVVTVEFLCEHILDDATSEEDAEQKIRSMLDESSVCNFGEGKVISIKVEK